MTLTGRRTLTTLIPPYIENAGVSDWPGGNGWQPTSSGNAVFFETYFDLSGYELADLTLVPTNINLQDPGRYSYTSIDPDPANGMMTVDIVSQERLNPETVYTELLNLNTTPGMSGSSYEQQMILYGQYRFWALDNSYSNIGNVNSVVNQGTFGTGEATAVAKLWVYRIVVPLFSNLQPAMVLSVPAARFNLFATIIDEKDLSYLMRLKRSYEAGPGPN